MGRLTRYDADGKLIVREEERLLRSNGIITKDEMYKIMRHLAEKLSEYEDLKEQGKLLMLPCAVGDMTYWADKKENKVRDYIVKRIEIESDGIFIITSEPIYHADDLGKTVFLTRQQAEEALKKIMEENSNE